MAITRARRHRERVERCWRVAQSRAPSRPGPSSFPRRGARGEAQAVLFLMAPYGVTDSGRYHVAGEGRGSRARHTEMVSSRDPLRGARRPGTWCSGDASRHRGGCFWASGRSSFARRPRRSASAQRQASSSSTSTWPVPRPGLGDPEGRGPRLDDLAPRQDTSSRCWQRPTPVTRKRSGQGRRAGERGRPETARASWSRGSQWLPVHGRTSPSCNWAMDWGVVSRVVIGRTSPLSLVTSEGREAVRMLE